MLFVSLKGDTELVESKANLFMIFSRVDGQFNIRGSRQRLLDHPTVSGAAEDLPSGVDRPRFGQAVDVDAVLLRFQFLIQKKIWKVETREKLMVIITSKRRYEKSPYEKSPTHQN